MKLTIALALSSVGFTDSSFPPKSSRNKSMACAAQPLLGRADEVEVQVAVLVGDDRQPARLATWPMVRRRKQDDIKAESRQRRQISSRQGKTGRYNLDCTYLQVAPWVVPWLPMAEATRALGAKQVLLVHERHCRGTEPPVHMFRCSPRHVFCPEHMTCCSKVRN